MPLINRSPSLLGLVALPLIACGGGGETVKPPPAPTASAAATTPPAPATTAGAAPTPAGAQTNEEAHKLVVLGAACWFGGVWADALGEQGELRKGGIESRCADLVKRIYDTDDKPHVEQVRALEPNSVGDFVAKVDMAAKNDTVDGPRRDALIKLATALAEAQKEGMTARRAADRVKRDLEHEPDKLNKDEVDALIPLHAHAKLESLLKLDAGDLSKEANALGVLLAMDRVEIARGLPKHLKLYAVADAFQLLFGVTRPDVPEDVTKKLVPGTWLTYLMDTAKAAGHPVPVTAKTPRDKDALAWAGMLEGISEKLKLCADGVAASTDLNKVVTTVLHRLEEEYRAQKGARPVTPPPKPVPKK
jgi:hypothetical protein